MHLPAAMAYGPQNCMSASIYDDTLHLIKKRFDALPSLNRSVLAKSKQRLIIPIQVSKLSDWSAHYIAVVLQSWLPVSEVKQYSLIKVIYIPIMAAGKLLEVRVIIRIYVLEVVWCSHQDQSVYVRGRI